MGQKMSQTAEWIPSVKASICHKQSPLRVMFQNITPYEQNAQEDGKAGPLSSALKH